MQRIQIQAKPFFDLLKSNEQSMWSIFAQLIDGEEKDVIFMDENNVVLFNFILPESLEELQSKQKEFTELFKSKLRENITKN